jgi:hypothetical protein
MGCCHGGANPCRTQSLSCIWFGASRVLTLSQPYYFENIFLDKNSEFHIPFFLNFENKLYRSLAIVCNKTHVNNP